MVPADPPQRVRLDDTFCFLFNSAPQTQKETRTLATVLTLPTRQIGNVRVTGQSLRNLLAGINAPNLNQPSTGLGHSLANDFSTLGFTFRTDNVSLALLLGALDDKPCSLGILLGDLLLLDGPRELLAESHVRDGDVLERDVELRRPFQQVGADAVRDSFALCDQLGGVELGDDCFEHFVADGGEDALVVVRTI